jgi:hypothetical protein
MSSKTKYAEGYNSSLCLILCTLRKELRKINTETYERRKIDNIL